MLTLCGLASVAVTLVVRWPLLVRGGAVLCSSWWLFGQQTGAVACIWTLILRFQWDAVGVVIVAYTLPLGAAKVVAVLCTQSGQ
jgi:hypothetical protein